MAPTAMTVWQPVRLRFVDRREAQARWVWARREECGRGRPGERWSGSLRGASTVGGIDICDVQSVALRQAINCSSGGDDGGFMSRGRRQTGRGLSYPVRRGGHRNVECRWEQHGAAASPPYLSPKSSLLQTHGHGRPKPFFAPMHPSCRLPQTPPNRSPGARMEHPVFPRPAWPRTCAGPKLACMLSAALVLWKRADAATLSTQGISMTSQGETDQIVSPSRRLNARPLERESHVQGRPGQSAQGTPGAGRLGAGPERSRLAHQGWWRWAARHVSTEDAVPYEDGVRSPITEPPVRGTVPGA